MHKGGKLDVGYDYIVPSNLHDEIVPHINPTETQGKLLADVQLQQDGPDSKSL